MQISPVRLAARALGAVCSLLVALGSVAQAGTWSGPTYLVSNRTPITDTNTDAPGGGAGGNTTLSPNGDAVIASGGLTPGAAEVRGTIKTTFTWAPDPNHANDPAPTKVYVLEHGQASWGLVAQENFTPPRRGRALQGAQPSVSEVGFRYSHRPRFFLMQAQTAAGTSDDGLGHPQVLATDGRSGSSSGNKISSYTVSNGQIKTSDVTLMASVTNPDASGASWGYSAQILTITMQNPTGDPTKAPDALLNINEFVFSQNPTTNFTEPGVCLVPCIAAISPDTEFTRNWAKTNISWQVDNVGDSVKTWVDSNGAADDNLGLTANCKFTNLPTHNNSFGPKTVTMTTPAGSVTTTIEVFFPPYGRNHPGSAQIPASDPSAVRSFNWFYYWKDALFPTSNAYFNDWAGDEAGEVPAMSKWSEVDNAGNPIDYDKTEVWINNKAALTIYRRDGSKAKATGIDAFANVMSHELIHVGQIAAADALVDTGVTPWERGWSWGIPKPDPRSPEADPRYNHYTLAFLNLDTDGDDMPDSMDNTNGNAPNVTNNAAGDLAVELPARAAETIENDHYKSVDWSSGGKNYQSTGN